MRKLAEKTGIPFCKDIDPWYSSREAAVRAYHSTFDSAAALSPRAKEAFDGMPQIADLRELQPSHDLENLIRNWLGNTLQRGEWFQDCKEYFLKEMLSGVTWEEVEQMFSGLEKDSRRSIFAVIATKEVS